MYWSKLFIPTLREPPAQAESAAHGLLIRAGYLRQFSSGNYHYLFAAQRALLKIEAVLRAEMASIGGQEVTLGAVEPVTSAIEDIAREIQSYRDFPQIWHHIGQYEHHSYSIDLSAESSKESLEKHRR